jgi:hypothetical protein
MLFGVEISAESTTTGLLYSSFLFPLAFSALSLGFEALSRESAVEDP